MHERVYESMSYDLRLETESIEMRVGILTAEFRFYTVGDFLSRKTVLPINTTNTNSCCEGRAQTVKQYQKAIENFPNPCSCCEGRARTQMKKRVSSTVKADTRQST